MIFTDRTITVRKGESRIDEPIVVYRGDYELEVRFTILNSRFKFMSGTNMIESEKASYGQLAILTPYGGNIFSDIVRCNDGSVTFVLTAEMLNQIEEVGLYSFQIRLMDYNKESRVSIPPIEFGIEVREPIASEDHDNSVNNAIVGYSIAKVVDPKEENVGDTFDGSGNYNKTKWETGDRISEGKLNKIEDALDKINQNEVSNTSTLSKRIDNNFNVLDATKADKNEIFSMKNMGQDIKEAMTGGSVAVVGRDTILNENIVDGQVSSSKMASSVILNEVEFDILTSGVGVDSLYIQPYTLIPNSIVSLKVKTLKQGENHFYLLHKDKDVFKTIDSVSVILSEGESILENLFVVYDENCYIGFNSESEICFKRENGDGFYEVYKYTSLSDTTMFDNVVDNRSTSFMLGIQIISTDMLLVNELKKYKTELDYISHHEILEIQNKKSVSPSAHNEISQNSIYIPNHMIELPEGEGYIHKAQITVNSNGAFKIYVLTKEVDSDIFVVKHVQQMDYYVGIKTYDIDYGFKSGDYIGLEGKILFDRTGGYGFYEYVFLNVNKFNVGDRIHINNSPVDPGDVGYDFKFAFHLEIDVRYINRDLIDLIISDGVDSKVELTDFKLLKYSEVEGEVGFLGRWFDREVNGVNCKCTINSGSEFYFKVKGATTVDVNFETNHAYYTPYFGYSIDGGEFTRQLITSSTLQNITSDEHIIRVVIDGLTEYEDKWRGEKGIAFRNVSVDSGVVKAVIPKNKTIMFFGDSITEGIRALNMNADARGNSSINAFPFECCKRLNSVSYRVGFGATGVAKPEGSGKVPDCLTYVDNMTIWRETPYFEPDIIVINHGTNDGGYDSVTFSSAYNKLLDRLTIKYPGIPIFTLIPFNQRHSDDIRYCVANRTNCYLVETQNWDISFTDGVHPDANGAIIAGEKLAQVITNVLGKEYFI